MLKKIKVRSLTNMTYDKCFIVNPQCAFEDVTIVNTLPFAHIDLDMLSLEYLN